MWSACACDSSVGGGPRLKTDDSCLCGLCVCVCVVCVFTFVCTFVFMRMGVCVLVKVCVQMFVSMMWSACACDSSGGGAQIENR